MIDRVVQRPFLLWLAEAVTVAGDIPGLAPELSAALARERALLPTFPDGDRRKDGDAPLEDRLYMPHEPILALVQSATELYLREHLPGRLLAVADEDNDRRDDDGVAGADLTLDLPDDAVPAVDATDRRLAGAFEITDIRWVSALVARGWRRFKDKHPFMDEPAPPRMLADNARVIVVGDWASGIPRARAVAAEMRRWLDEGADREQHVVHLGDTYYAGWEHEYRERFLPYWPVQPGEPHGSYSLNGNHDMYTGGHAYFDVLLDESRFQPFHQGSSWFSLENDHWQLLGLDTAWEDHDLAGDQAAWVGRKLVEHPDRRTMLLSHHQLFSAYGSGGTKLAAKLRDPLGSGRIDAWLWGHEHRCVAYEPYGGVHAARCLGHGGVPVYAGRDRPTPPNWRLDRWFRAGLEPWAYMGFAVLDFAGPQITMTYVDEFGKVNRTETIG